VIQNIYVNIKKLKINVLNVMAAEYVNIKNVKAYAFIAMEHICVNMQNNVINVSSVLQIVVANTVNKYQFLVRVGNPTVFVATVY